MTGPLDEHAQLVEIDRLETLVTALGGATDPVYRDDPEDHGEAGECDVTDDITLGIRRDRVRAWTPDPRLPPPAHERRGTDRWRMWCRDWDEAE